MPPCLPPHWRPLPLLALLVTLLATPNAAQAFCGFFAGKSDATLVSEASSLVILREGQRTVLTLQPYYRGPIEDFSIILPVPTVLRKHQVETLDPKLLARVDSLGAPRLVEYWEQDPCSLELELELELITGGLVGATITSTTNRNPLPAVRVEAKFTVGEYEIVILGARDSLALESWLRAHDYQLPAGASEALRPYVATGSRFFVARVNARKVKFEGDRALLSPLRFFYDSPELSIPVRLGLLNAAGEQDLVVTVVSREGRYEAANRPNVAVPTNLDLLPETRAHFDEFYAALLDHSFAAAPEAVLTEYAWPVSSCDPCPGTDSTLSLDDLASLGLDRVPIDTELIDTTPAPPIPWSMSLSESMLQRGFDGFEQRRQWPSPSEFALTRLHIRISPDDKHQDDIVLRRAGPITGGREGQDTHVQASNYGQSDFQARYAIRHRWEGPVRCDAPVYERWGHRPASSEPTPPLAPTSPPPAYLRTSKPVSVFLANGELGQEHGFDGEIAASPLLEVPPLAEPKLAHCSVRTDARGHGWGLLALFGLWAWRRPRSTARPLEN